MDLVKVLSEQQLKSDLPTLKIGDTVKVMETRPLSKDKRWRLVEIVEKAK